MFAQAEEPDHRRQLRESVQDFVAREATGRNIRAALALPEAFCRTRWRRMAELGWTAVLIAEEDGGFGLQHGDLVALHQEFGRGAFPEPLIGVALLAARTIAGSANAALKRDRLPALTGGRLIATLAWQGRPGVLGADGVGPVAVRRTGGWSVSGTALCVPLAPVADAAIVAARTADGVLLGWLPALDGCEVEATPFADGSRHGAVRFRDVVVPDDRVLAVGPAGEALLEETLDTARLAACAELLGGMERTLTMTLDHLRQRQQFGKPIGSFQALQHRAVDLYVQVELARSALARATAAHDDGADAAQRAAAVSAAKSRCSDAALLVAKQAIQLHGAIGYTDEYDLSLFVRRALVRAAELGNAVAHRARYARINRLAGGEE